MMISFSFIMFLTISIFTIFLHLNVFPQLKDEITYSNLELCVKTSESLDNHIEKIDDITKKLISNKTLMQILKMCIRDSFNCSREMRHEAKIGNRGGKKETRSFQ